MLIAIAPAPPKRIYKDSPEGIQVNARVRKASEVVDAMSPYQGIEVLEERRNEVIACVWSLRNNASNPSDREHRKQMARLNAIRRDIDDHLLVLHYRKHRPLS